jgi:hypothetical protein
VGPLQPFIKGRYNRLTMMLGWTLSSARREFGLIMKLNFVILDRNDLGSAALGAHLQHNLLPFPPI